MQLFRYVAKRVFERQLHFMLRQFQIPLWRTADAVLQLGIFRQYRIQFDRHGGFNLFVCQHGTLLSFACTIS